MEDRNKRSLLHSFTQGQSKPIFTGMFLTFLSLIILFGIGAGYMLAQNGGQVGGVNVGNVTTGGGSGNIEGTDDLKTFKDTAEGVLQEGGIEGEGQFHLERPGGESQYVYMTSSIVDLSKYKGRKIKVWGQTQKAQRAGWLMDVGRVQVL